MATDLPDSSDGKRQCRDHRPHIGDEDERSTTRRRPNPQDARNHPLGNSHPAHRRQAPWHAILAYFIGHVQNYTVLPGGPAYAKAHGRS